MKKIQFLLLPAFLAAFAISCSSIPGKGDDPLRDQLKAENRVMKNNLCLAQRENEVLNTENIQYKNQISDLQATVESLKKDLESLHSQYDADMAQMNAKYEDMCARYTVLERDSTQKIDELTESKAALEKKLSDEVSRLNGLLADQQDAFARERDSLKAETASRNKDYEDRLAVLADDINKKQSVIASLKDAQTDANQKIKDLKKSLSETAARINEINNKKQDLIEENRKLQKIIDEKQAAIDLLNGAQTPMPAPQDPMKNE